MNQHIALVEDDECFGTMFVYNLEALGFKVEWFRSARDAQFRLTSPPYPDLVVLDWTLPRIGGWEVLRWIRCNHDTSTLPVIMLTCHGDADTRNQALSLGATDFITKGIPLKAVLARIRSIGDMAGVISSTRESAS